MSTTLLSIALSSLLGEDCNGNGREDALDVRPGELRLADPLPDGLVFPAGSVAAVIVELDGDGVLDMVLADSEGIAVARADASGELVSGQTVPVGSVPRAITAADADGDGDIDIVTANGMAGAFPGNVSVLRNDRGVLGIPRNHAASRFPASIAAGDLDADGDLDLITVGDTLDGVADGVTVLRNDGAGRFDLDGTYDVGSQPPSGPPVIADIDGDDAPDVLIAKPNRLATSIQLLFGDGRGRLDRKLELGLELGEVPALLLAIDADRDGDPDIASAGVVVGGQGAGTFSILRNEAGTLAPAARLADIAGPADAAAADLDGDGVFDVAITQVFAPGVTVLSGRGDGTFAQPRSHLLLGLRREIEIVDWDRDGRLDLLSLGLVGGSGSIIPGQYLGGPAAAPAWMPAGDPYSPIFADLDGDGDVDLAAATEEPEGLVVFRNDDGAFLPLPAHAVSEIEELIAADIDGDGRMDMAAASEQGFDVFFGRGGGAFERVHLRSGALAGAFAEDMDGDGDLDLLAPTSNAGGVLALFRNAGARAFEPVLHFGPGLQADIGAVPPVTADLDADGDIDVLAVDAGVFIDGRRQGMEVLSFLNRGDGAFDPLRILDLDKPPEFIRAGDLNGDARPDAVLALLGCESCPVPEPSQVLILHGDGDGHLREVERHPAEGAPGWLELRDMDGDGRQDIVLLSYNTRSFQVLRNGGSGRFSGETIPGIETLAVSLVAEDLDGDGDVDIAAPGRSATSGSCRCDLFQVDVFENRGDGVFEKPRRFVTISPAWVAVSSPVGPGTVPSLLLIEDEGLLLLGNLTEPPASRDANRDGVPDECGTGFHRGDPSGDGAADMSDAILVLLHLFAGGEEPGCLDSADANDDGTLDITDPIGILEWLFLGGAPPPDPGPPGAPCGLDPPGSTLGCEGYGGCARAG